VQPQHGARFKFDAVDLHDLLLCLALTLFRPARAG